MEQLVDNERRKKDQRKVGLKEDLHRNKFLNFPSHISTPSSTCDAISGGMTGDAGPVIRSSPTKIVSSIVGCESTKTTKKKN